MDPPVLLRDVRWSDFPDLCQTYYECYDERKAGEPIGIVLFADKPSLAEETRWFSTMFARVQEGSQISVIADAGGHAVGSCSVVRRGGPPGSEVGHVGDLGILLRRSHRGRGVGELLMRETLRRCQGTFELVILSVFSDNERAKSLYRKVGFERCGTLPGAVRRGDRRLDEEVMCLRLPPVTRPSTPR